MTLSLNKTLISSVTVSALIAFLAPSAFARDQIRVVGSSTVYPFSSTAAEEFGREGKFKTPIVESTGTGGGFKLFCAGKGDSHPDISGASRPITDSETELCKKNGVAAIVEIPIGYDGIVLANAQGAPKLQLTKKQIFMALAAKVPDKDGNLAPNPYRKWNEIDPKLPAQPILVYGPPTTSGTRDAFIELVMEEAAKGMDAFKKAYPDDAQRKKAAALLREDGVYVDSGEDDNLIIRKLTANKEAVGIFGYSFLEENKGKVQASSVDGILPSMENIENGQYKVSRSLYLYVKGEQLGGVPGLAEFANFVVSEDAIGTNGYLIAKGLLPLHDSDKATARQRAAALKKALY